MFQTVYVYHCVSHLLDSTTTFIFVWIANWIHLNRCISYVYSS